MKCAPISVVCLIKKYIENCKKLMSHKIFPYLCNSNNFNGPATEWHTDQAANTDCFAVKVAFYLDELDENSGGLRFLLVRIENL